MLQRTNVLLSLFLRSKIHSLSQNQNQKEMKVKEHDLDIAEVQQKGVLWI